MKIAVIGTGYQGLSEAAVLSKNNDVTILRTTETDEIVLSKFTEYEVSDLENRICDKPEKALSEAEIAVISIPVFYDTELNTYYLHDVDMYINLVRQYAQGALIIMRSDVPVGYTERIMSKYSDVKMVFVPDFSREIRALEDAFSPSRLVIGSNDKVLAEKAYDILKSDCEVIFTNPSEAESVKLFANTFLAMRVAFFNELDTYAEIRGLDSKNIIRSVSMDPRIGDLYNNPSFGFGGRSLVEGSCRLRNDLEDIPERIVDMVETSNVIRKEHITNQILKSKPKVCGIYGIQINTGFRDFRYSPVTGVIKGLQENGVRVIIFDPMINIERLLSADVVDDFERFCEMSDVIIANRLDENIKKYSGKLYTRDIFERD